MLLERYGLKGRMLETLIDLHEKTEYKVRGKVFRGCSVAQKVHLLSHLRVLELMGTRSLPTHPRPLSTAVLARTIGKLPKHHSSASAKSRDVTSTGDFTATLLESALASNPTLTGGVSAKIAPCLSRHGQPAATLLKGKETVAWCAS